MVIHSGKNPSARSYQVRDDLLPVRHVQLSYQNDCASFVTLVIFITDNAKILQILWNF